MSDATKPRLTETKELGVSADADRATHEPSQSSLSRPMVSVADAGSYMTNTPLENEARCKWAAEQTGFNVEFCRHPIPFDPWDPDCDHYHPDGLVGVYGSILTHEPGRDHTAFWDAWYAYPGEAA